MSNMKPSAIPWIEAIPAHWNVKILGMEATVKARLGWKGLKASEYVDEGYIFLSTPNIKNQAIDFENVNYITEERYLESPEIMLQRGDVLLAKDGSTLGTVNVVRNLPAPATVNSSIAVIRPSKIFDSIFLYYFLSSHFIQSLIQQMKDGMGVPHLFQDDIRKFPIFCPPIEEQQSIAHFLDHKTAAIDTLIEKKQRLIQLLEERRTTLINQAVTKGLNPNASMKDSGIPWIGEIPKHWLKVPVKRACVSVRDGTHNPPPRVEQGEYRLLSARNIQDGEFILRDDDRLMNADAFLELEKSYSVREGDVVIAVVGATTGKSAVVGDVEKVSVQRSVAILRPRSDVIYSRYLNFLISSLSLQYEIASVSSKYAAQGGIYLDDLANLSCVFPPSLEEQADILSSLARALTPILQIKKKLSEQIDKLQKYRQSLITAAVTGKLALGEENAP